MWLVLGAVSGLVCLYSPDPMCMVWPVVLYVATAYHMGASGLVVGLGWFFSGFVGHRGCDTVGVHVV